jgi:hypothetical protein
MDKDVFYFKKGTYLMSLTFNAPSTNGNPDNVGAKPTKPTQPKKLSPLEQSKQKQKDNLKKQQVQIQKKLERLSDCLRKTAKFVYAEDPNDDPNYLFQQVRPVLSEMYLHNIAVNRKTQLIPGQSNSKKESLYRVLLRRTAEITPDIINRLKRAEKNLDYIKWHAEGMEVYVWATYEPPAGEATI